MKKILFISGSARNGCCKEILEILQSNFWLDYRTDLVFIRDYDPQPCQGCENCYDRGCQPNPLCATDDRMKILMEKVIESDIIVLATPNYFFNVSSLTKNFMDKTNIFYHKKLLKDKKFVYIYVGNDDVTNTKKYLDNAMYGFTICHELNVLGSYALQSDSHKNFVDEEAKNQTIADIVTAIRNNLSD